MPEVEFCEDLSRAVERWPDAACPNCYAGRMQFLTVPNANWVGRDPYSHAMDEVHWMATCPLCGHEREGVVTRRMFVNEDDLDFATEKMALLGYGRTR